MPDGMNIDNRVLEEIKSEVSKFGSDFKALDESLRRDLEAARKAAEEAGKRADQSEVKATIDALSRSVIEKHAAIEAKMAEVNARSDAIETALKRAPVTNEAEEKALHECKADAVEFFKAASAISNGRFSARDLTPDRVDVSGYKAWADSFGMAMRYGAADRSIDAKALSVGVDPDGGFLVPTQVSRRIISRFYETSPIRQIAMVETIGTDEYEIPVDEDEAGVGWANETQTRAETTTPKFGKKIIATHEQYAEPRATQKLLDDASIDMEQWLANKVSERFARAEATAFVVGTGVGQPRGFTTYPNGTSRNQIEQVASGAATAVLADGLINLTMSLKAPYLGNATWLMKRSTEAAVLVLKNGQGDYMWRPGLTVGQPAALLSYPVRQADDMPVIGAGTTPIAFGDFRQGYTIVDRMGIRTLRDPFTAKPFVKFYTTRRVGGDVVLFEAIKLMVISA